MEELHDSMWGKNVNQHTLKRNILNFYKINNFLNKTIQNNLMYHALYAQC